jgi:hypothetical protein
VLSPQAHVVEDPENRRRPKLELTIIIEDPVNYTRPTSRPSVSWRPDQQMLEYQCEENMEGARRD